MRKMGWTSYLMGGHLILTFAGTLHAADTSYIAAVKADLAEFKTGAFTLSESNAWQRSQQASESDGTASLADFETFVKRKFRGTYILFTRLPDWKKNQIWQDYVSTGDLGGIRSNIYAARSKKDTTSQRSSLSNLPLDF